MENSLNQSAKKLEIRFLKMNITRLYFTKFQTRRNFSPLIVDGGIRSLFLSKRNLTYSRKPVFHLYVFNIYLSLSELWNDF